ncbi:MAG: flippase-like domain-containing protein [Myxococcales bacterium]|nr:flippase-like domain-containing protein [Myxococcales bacterium]
MSQSTGDTSRRERLIRWAVGLVIGGLFTWLSARNWPLDKLFSGDLSLARRAGGALSLSLINDAGVTNWSIKLANLAGYLGCLFVIHWLRVLRWRPLLLAFTDAPLRVVNRIGAIGFVAVFMLPLRLGEFARPWLANTDTGIPFGTALSTIAVERVIDGLMVTLLLFAVLVQVPDSQLARYPELQLGAFAALSVFGGATVVLLGTVVARDLTLSILRRLIGLVSNKLADKIIGLVTTFIDGLSVLKSPAAVATFLGMTVSYWSVVGLGIWLMATGFGLDVPLVAGYAMMCCVVVGMMIPNSPGNVGSFWYFMLLPAGLYGIDADSPRAIGFGLGVWFVQTLQVCLFGLWGLWARARAQSRDQHTQQEAPSAP